MTFNQFRKHILENNKESTLFNGTDKACSQRFIEYIVFKLTQVHNELKRNNIVINNYGALADILAVSHLTGHSIIKTYEENVIFDLNDSNFGKSDGGIDGFYLQNNILFLIQVKLDRISKSDYLKMKESYESFIENELPLNNDSKSLKKLVNFCKANANNIDDIKYICISPFTNTSFRDEKSYIYKTFKDVMSEAVANINKRLVITMKEYSDYEKWGEDKEDSDSAMVKVSGVEFLSKLRDYNSTCLDSIFEKNVRGAIFKKDFVDSFLNTIRKEPEWFEVYNNGITIIVKNFKKNHKNLVTLEDPQIINGQQTTRTLLKIQEMKEDYDNRMARGNKPRKGEEERFNFDLSKIFVYLKIAKASTDESIMNIAKNSNSQTKIKAGDLVTATEGFKNLNKNALTLNYFIMAKEGRSEKKDFYKTIDNRSIELSEIVKVHVVKYNKILIPSAKTSIGAVMQKYIAEKKLDEIDLKKLRKILAVIEIKDKYIKQMKNSNSSLEKKLADEANKIYQFAELAVIALICENKTYDQIKNKLDHFAKTYEGNSMINEFKKPDGYRKLGIHIPEPIKKQKIDNP